jgi:hypothetical protein
MNSDGLITGTPSAAGQTIPWVELHDKLPSQGGNSWCGADVPSQRQFIFNVRPGLAIQQQSVPGGTINKPYSQQLSVASVSSLNPLTSTPTTATWVVQSGALPPGVTLSSAGLLSGTPTAEGSFTFVVRADSGGVSDTETETLTVRQPLAVNSPFASAAPPKAEVGIPFSVPQSATGGSGKFTWALAQGGALPAGLALGADGTVSGTPTVAGRFSFTLTLSDSESRSVNVNVTLVVAQRLAFRSLRLPAATAGHAYRAKIATVGGVAPKTFTIRGKLPRGVTFSKKTGILLGTPRAAGTFRVTVQVVDSLHAKAAAKLTLSVTG